MNDTFAIVYAGHGNPFLGDLIAHRCAAAIPLAGRYRAIDVLLSNLSQSGVRNVGVVMQRNFQSLVEHIGAGGAWDLNSKNGGVTLLTPFDQGMATGLYQGLGDALFAKRYYIDRQRARYCLLLASDTVYREDYNRLLDHHRETGADITMLCSSDPRAGLGDPSHAVKLRVKDGWAEGIDYGPTESDGSRYSLDACILDKGLMVRLVEDACAEGRYSIMADMIESLLQTHRVAALEHEGYAARLTSVKSYYDMMRDMLDPEVRQELFYEHGPVYTRVADAPPMRFAGGCEVADSVVGNGCDVRGRVVRSLLFRGVSVAPGADVENCVVMQDSRIGEGAHLRNVIIDKSVVVGAGARLIGSPDSPLVVRKGSIIEGGDGGR